jgi:2-polyprenyl-3-methyl-5-hydroxy-6-metoxy-1,4-benzoquinol methylase
MADRTPLREDGIVAGNVYDKYGTRNPVARRLMQGFLAAAESLVAESGAREIHEIGCGEGLLALALARDGRRVRGSDRSRQVIEIARENARQRGAQVEFSVTEVEALAPPGDSAELIVCCEVLEHLEDPIGGLARLASLAAPHLLVSVPREPLWRILNLARGKYLADLGNTPGHLQHWSKRGFLALLEARVDVVAVRSPLPWTMALCRARA